MEQANARLAAEDDINSIMDFLKDIKEDSKAYYVFDMLSEKTSDKSMNNNMYRARIVRSMIFGQETDWVLHYDFNDLIGVSLISYPSHIMRNTTVSLLFNAYKKVSLLDQVSLLAVVNKLTPLEYTKIKAVASSINEELIQLGFELELEISYLNSKDFVYSSY
ncbi:hypothetical protein [Paenibacillus sp. FSL R7-0179]|uniref:hypothetical protein n=1 Tax=Paenibacillus sp. FSL R7-0179 TaxID=2921672 RepID=UPI0030FB991B